MHSFSFTVSSKNIHRSNFLFDCLNSGNDWAAGLGQFVLLLRSAVAAGLLGAIGSHQPLVGLALGKVQVVLVDGLGFLFASPDVAASLLAVGRLGVVARQAIALTK